MTKLLAPEALDAAWVGERLALGDADPRLVGLEIVRPEELHRVCRHHRQLQVGRQRHRGADVRLVAGQAGALQFDVEPARKTRRQTLCRGPGPRAVVGQQGLADHALVGAGKRDQSVVQLLDPGPLHPGLVALGALAQLKPGARQQLAQVQPALAALHQQQQPAWLAVDATFGTVGLEPDVGADHRLDTRLACRAVELDRPEDVGQVGDRHRHLAVGRRGRHRLVDAQAAVDDRELGVGAQVDEGHGEDCRQRLLPRIPA